ncbi:hypothetical protein JCGZ_11301 [Jatropha curcas]|uniref:SAP domain-containing protein n=1 Tax=Jatropha curcas TaxID=180498 RepID=A0A067KF86_JATCU|nr:hypothetical protein JCGZ_11301 [Jatropha curcas]
MAGLQLREAMLKLVLDKAVSVLILIQGLDSRSSDRELYSLTVERLRALLKERGLSPKGKKASILLYIDNLYTILDFFVTHTHASKEANKQDGGLYADILRLITILICASAGNWFILSYVQDELVARLRNANG